MGLLSGVIDDIGDKIDAALRNTGEWAASVLDKGTQIYNRFIGVGYEAITKDIDSGDFSSFWTVVNNANRIMISIASTVMVFLFLYNIITDALEVSKEVNLWGTVKQLVKLIICNFIVANSLVIVKSILKAGTIIAVAMTGNVSELGVNIYDNDEGLNEDIKNGLITRVHGLSGLITTIVAVLGAIVMIACAIMIIFEVYKRFFKIFVLMPFASLSFSTFVMGDGNRGNEMFRGYIKNTLVISAEAIIIVLCMAFTAVLTKDDGGFISSLFKIDGDPVVLKCELDSSDEAELFNSLFSSNRKGFSISKEQVLSKFNDGENVYSILTSSEYDSYTVSGTVDLEGVTTSSGLINSFSDGNWMEGMISEMFSNNIYNYPVYVTSYKEISLGVSLIYILWACFPMILCAGAVKESGILAQKAFGM